MSQVFASGPRRLGLTKNNHFASLHGERIKKEQPALRVPAPGDEDINRPPDDSSDDSSIDSDCEFGNEQPSKRRKAESAEDMDSRLKREPSEPSSSWGPLANEPSSIQPSVFKQGSQRSLDDDELGESFSQPSQSRKRLSNVYTRKPTAPNIHIDGPAPKEEKRNKSSPAKRRQDAQGFISRDTKDLEAKFLDDEIQSKTTATFTAPRQIDIASPRKKRASQRSTRSSGNAAKDGQANPRIHNQSDSDQGSPSNSQKSRPMFKAPVIPDVKSPRRRSRPVKLFKQPLAPCDPNGMGVNDMQELLHDVKSSALLSSIVPVPSIVGSTMPSTSFDNGSSSSLSPAPSSPGTDYEVHDLTGTKAEEEKPAQALCPVCKVPVDRAFLEEFNDGEPLRARQQTLFCKAHKIRAAEEEWTGKRYPRIDWSHFDKRIEKFHPFIDDILSGKRSSYYRNALEDRISKGQMRTLKATIFNSDGVEGVIPGYYGTRGARAIIENITSKHAPRIRRLASTDRVISTGGVPSYIQLVLAPEMAIHLVMDDMKVDEEGARSIIRDSVDIGNLLNEEQDEAIEVIESEDELQA